MAYKKRNNTEKIETTRTDVGHDFFLHFRENDYGLFALEHNGAIIYGCRLVNGNNGTFVSYPSYQTGYKRYFSHARFLEPIPDEVVENIANAIRF